ncbi:MAG: hypothetical protein HYZ49_11210 [Chloroflexi bacterium]|nr:hypothetical protein [Chloroflexota bacterium]
MMVAKYAFPFHQARNPEADNQTPTSFDNNAIRIQMSSFPGSHRPEEILPFADLVVLAEITQIGPARWNTTDGLRPDDWRPGLEATWMIYTPFTFETVKTLKGTAAKGFISQFAAVGGKAGDDQVEVSDFGLYSDLAVGDQVILFLGTSTGNMINVAPYTYGDALRIDGTQATADCGGSREVKDCRVAFSLSDVLARVTSSQNNGLNIQGDAPAP